MVFLMCFFHVPFDISFKKHFSKGQFHNGISLCIDQLPNPAQFKDEIFRRYYISGSYTLVR